MSNHTTTSHTQKALFAGWLRDQLALRRWHATNLAQHAGISASTIYQLLHSKHAPDPGTCQKLAKALCLPVDLVCEKAGFLPAKAGALSLSKRTLINLVKSMPDADALRFLARSQARMVTQADGKWWV